MPFQSFGSSIKPRIGQSISLGCGNIDPATLTLTFHYQERVKGDGTWRTAERKQTLVENTHYTLDARAGLVTLLDHKRWKEKSTWRAGDRFESLLYKGQVRHPQYVQVKFEHYAPTPVEPGTKVNWDKTNREAKKRLGYDVPEYGVSP